MYSTGRAPHHKVPSAALQEFGSQGYQKSRALARGPSGTSMAKCSLFSDQERVDKIVDYIPPLPQRITTTPTGGGTPTRGLVHPHSSRTPLGSSQVVQDDQTRVRIFLIVLHQKSLVNESKTIPDGLFAQTTSTTIFAAPRARFDCCLNKLAAQAHCALRTSRKALPSMEKAPAARNCPAIFRYSR